MEADNNTYLNDSKVISDNSNDKDLFFSNKSIPIPTPTNDSLETNTSISSFAKMNFGIFTVINTTDNDKTNNPPTPPYININKLIFYTNIDFNSEKLKIEIMNILKKMYTYKYWKNTNQYNLYVTKFNNNNHLTDSADYMIKSMGESLIEIISNVNPSTLIGSLESTTVLQNITYNDLICYEDKNREDILNKFKHLGLSNDSRTKILIQKNNNLTGGLPIGNQPVTDEYKQKYIKYKKKYINLLKKSHFFL
jgi:hypothetical protein